MLEKYKAIIALNIILFLIFCSNHTHFKEATSQKINIKKIKSFYTADSQATLKSNLFRHTVDAKIFYQNNKFRFIIYNKNYVNLDVGCNEKYFWYYSSDQPSMYYSKIEDAKIVFVEVLDPDWIMNVLSCDAKETSTINEKEVITTLFGDSMNKKLVKKNIILADVEITLNEDKLQKIYLNFNKSINIEIKIKDIVTDEKIDDNVFEMPKKFKSEYLLP